MKFGILFLPTYVPELDGSEAQAYQHMLDQVDRAEALGFESVWLTEHHFQYYGGLVPSPPILAAAIAQRTRRIRIGMAVTLLPFHRPVRVAEDMAMVDILSGGRLDWGVGRGFLNWEYQNLGVQVEESRDRFAECLEIILKAWAEDSFSYEGRFHQYRDLSVVPRPLQRPHPPIWFAASASEESFILAGRRGYNLMTIPHTHAAEDIRRKIQLYRVSLAEAGFDPGSRQVFARYYVYVADSAAEARRDVEGPYLRNGEIAARANALGRINARADVRLEKTYDQAVDEHRMLFGSVDDCVEHLRWVRDEIGVDYVGASFWFGGLPQEKALRSMDTFVREVVSRLERVPASAARG
jgi:natural product biosynthesis luciferase-like monooxygenase protein